MNPTQTEMSNESVHLTNDVMYLYKICGANYFWWSSPSDWSKNYAPWHEVQQEILLFNYILEWTLQSLLPYFCRINKLELKLSEMRSNFVTIHTGRINQTSDDWRFISKESIFCQPFFLLIFNEGVNFQCICMVYIWHNKQQSHTDWFFLCEMNRSSVRDSLYGRIINCFS